VSGSMIDKIHPDFARQLEQLKKILSALREVSKELDSWHLEMAATLLGTPDPWVRDVLLPMQREMVVDSLQSIARRNDRMFEHLSDSLKPADKSGGELSGQASPGALPCTEELAWAHSQQLAPELLDWA